MNFLEFISESEEQREFVEAKLPLSSLFGPRQPALSVPHLYHNFPYRSCGPSPPPRGSYHFTVRLLLRHSLALSVFSVFSVLCRVQIVFAHLPGGWPVPEKRLSLRGKPEASRQAPSVRQPTNRSSSTFTPANSFNTPKRHPPLSFASSSTIINHHQPYQPYQPYRPYHELISRPLSAFLFPLSVYAGVTLAHSSIHLEFLSES